MKLRLFKPSLFYLDPPAVDKHGRPLPGRRPNEGRHVQFYAWQHISRFIFIYIDRLKNIHQHQLDYVTVLSTRGPARFYV